MNLVWSGRRFINLDYLITAEDADGAPGPGSPPHLRLMMEGGTVVPCCGEAAAAIWRRLGELAGGGSPPPGLDDPPEPETVKPKNGSAAHAPDTRPESA